MLISISYIFFPIHLECLPLITNHVSMRRLSLDGQNYLMEISQMMKDSAI